MRAGSLVVVILVVYARKVTAKPEVNLFIILIFCLFFFFQGAVSATYQAIRNQSPLVPAMGNITMSDLARRRKKSKVKEDNAGSSAGNASVTGTGNNPDDSPSTPV